MKDKIKIIKNILKAQAFSDAAKEESGAKKKELYKKKDAAILAAYKIINTTRNSRVNYKKIRGYDQNGHLSLIFYFEFKMKGKLFQFSFHSFNFNLFGDNLQGDKNIVWDGIIGQSRTNKMLVNSILYNKKI